LSDTALTKSACGRHVKILDYIKSVPKGDGIRVAAYEFTHKPVLDELRRTLGRGIDVRIVYEDTSDTDDRPNETAIEGSKIPATFEGRRVLFRRKPEKGGIPHSKFPEKGGIPHSKFMVHLRRIKVPLRADSSARPVESPVSTLSEGCPWGPGRPPRVTGSFEGGKGPSPLPPALSGARP
jgi:hypothetical protein